MADNVPVTPGSGATIATDDVGGVQFQRVKLDVGADGVSAPVVGSLPVADAAVAALLTSIDGKTPILSGGAVPTLLAIAAAAYSPGYDAQDQGGGDIATDPSGNLNVRSQVLTDEGTFRCNFANSSLAVSIGSATLTNGSRAVTWSLTSTTDLHAGDYIKLDADAESAWAQIESVDSLTGGTLVAAYTGTGGTSAASRALLKPSTAAGASITVGSGQATIACGTTAAVVTRLRRFADYAPLVIRQRVSISQRIANQSIYMGCGEDVAAPRWFARFKADGTTNTTIKCQTGRNPTGAPSASEIEETTVTLPNGATTATLRDYRVELMTEVVRFYIDGILVASHNRVIPAQHDEMTAGVSCENGTTPASGTSVVIDYLTAKNHNKLEISVLSDADQIVAATATPAAFTYNVAGAITINTDLLIIDCAQFRSVSIQCTSMGTSGVVTPAWSNDGTNFTAAGTLTTAGGASVGTFNAAGHWTTAVLGRYLRLRLTTGASAGTTTLFVAGFQQVIGPLIVSSPTGANFHTNINQIAGQTPLTLQPNGSTNRAIVAGHAGPLNNTDYSAQAWAAASGSGATISVGSGLGTSTAFDVNLTAWTAGGSTGLVVFLQESPDNGTTWYDIWQCETLTAVSRARIPAIPIGGRRRMRWVNLTGAATTATVTVTAMDCSISAAKQMQWFDRTASVTSGTAALGNGAAFNINGCTAMTAAMQTGTATAPASFKVQMSMDGTNWYDASTAVSCPASSMTLIPLTAGVYGRFGRFVCTVAGTSALVSAGHFYGMGD
jgi:hypothetical protein